MFINSLILPIEVGNLCTLLPIALSTMLITVGNKQEPHPLLPIQKYALPKHDIIPHRKSFR